MKMKKILTILVLYCFTAMLLTGCHRKQEPVPKLLEPVRASVDIYKVCSTDIYDLEARDGFVVPEFVEVKPKVPGMISEIHITTGDTVKKGQPLFKLNGADITNQIRQTEDSITQMKEQNEYTNDAFALELEKMNLELDQLKNCHNQTGIKLKELDIKELKLQIDYNSDIQKIDLDALVSQRNALEQQLDTLTIMAPADGKVIYSDTLQVNRYVNSYDIVMKLAVSGNSYIKTDLIDNKQLEDYDEIYTCLDGNKYELSSLEYTPDEKTKITLSNGEKYSKFTIKDKQLLTVGEYIPLYFVKNKKEKVLAIPIKALYSNAGTDYVYKIVNDARVYTEVQLGVSTYDMVEVVEGISEGDEIYVHK